MSASLCLLPGQVKTRDGEERSRSRWLVEQGQEWFAIWRVKSLDSEGDESSPIMGGKNNHMQMIMFLPSGEKTRLLLCF